MIPVLLAAVAFVLVVAGTALLSVPAALIVAGACLGVVALLVDFDRNGGG